MALLPAAKRLCYSPAPPHGHNRARPPTPAFILILLMKDNAVLRDVESWLASSAGLPPAEEIQAIRRHLAAIGAKAPPSPDRQRLLDGLHIHTRGAIEALMPRLFNVRLPVSNHTRLTVRSMQDALENLARMGLDWVEQSDIRLAQCSTVPTEQILWQTLEALRLNLQLSNLVAAPTAPGTWRNLHRTYLAMRRHQAESSQPVAGQPDLRTLYARTLILGLLPPSALNAQEWAFLYRFMNASSTTLTVSDSPPDNNTNSTIWTSPENDSAPMLHERRAPCDGTLAVYVPCPDILAEIKATLSTLVQTDDLPEKLSAETPPRTARAALRRLRDQLSFPRKRRFPRRRQGYRSTLCIGFDDICTLLVNESTSSDLLTEWMIVNESPGGYAAMHVSGQPRKAQVGDLVATKRDGENTWGICMVRWALSENPLHLEFGLEEISPRAIVGHTSTPGHTEKRHPRALWLPALPPLRKSDALASSPGAAPAKNQDHFFVSSATPEHVRKFRIDRAIEQSSGADVFLIAEP